MELGAEVTFAGTELRVCYVVPVHENGILKCKASLQVWQEYLTNLKYVIVIRRGTA